MVSRNTWFCCLAVIALAGSGIQAADVKAATANEGALIRPTAIACDDEGRYWCANLGRNVLGPAKDSHGYVVQIDAQGQPLTNVRFPAPGDPPLGSPEALVAQGNLLWVADRDRLVVYNLRMQRQEGIIPLRGHGVRRITALCLIGNDILISDAENDLLLLLRGTDQGAVQHIDIVERGVGQPQALAFDPANNLLFVAVTPDPAVGERGGIVSYEWGELLSRRARLALGDGLWTSILRQADGTTLACSPSGIFARLRPGHPLETIVQDLVEPGGFCQLQDGTAALVPERAANRVRVIPLSR